MDIFPNKNEGVLSENDWKLIYASFDWEVDQPVCEDMLYHYYSSRSLKKVLTKDAIVFRLSAASEFKDKMEGKAVEVYYDLALSELKNEKRISEEQYEAFSRFSVPEKLFLPYQIENGLDVWGETDYEEYIICFSTVEDDKYMFEKYISNSDGYCLHFLKLDLQELMFRGINNHAQVKLIPVLYGRHVVDFIRERIELIATDPVKANKCAFFIEELLHYVQYAAKLEKYSKENEVRLVVFCPRNSMKDSFSENLIRDEDGKHLYFSVEKELLFKVTPAPYNNEKETSEVIEYLFDSGYSSAVQN